MSKFKIGDRVQSVNYPADVGTVLELLNHDIILVSLDASKGKWSYHVKDLELIGDTEVASKFKVGDRVRLIGYTGYTGVILELSNNGEIARISMTLWGERSYYTKELELVEKKETEESSAVAKPSHYQILPGIEVRDICNTLADQLSDKGFKGSFIGEYMQVMQYLMRFHKKNGLEDIKKAQYLLNKLVDNYTEFP